MRKKITIIALIAAAVAGTAVYRALSQRDPGVQVLTARATRGDIIRTVSSTGALQAVVTVQVGTQVSGTIKELHADFNSVVRRGQVLARLDPSLFQAQVEQVRAALLKAKSDEQAATVALADARVKLARAEKLSAKQLIPQSDLDTARVAQETAAAELQSAKSQVTQAQANLDQSQVNLAHTVILAPIDGTVISRNVDVGQTVAASLQSPTLFVIAADLAKMQVSANVDESDIGQVRPGQPVTFEVDAYPGETFSGTVSQVRLQAVVTQNVVTYATVIDVPNPEMKLKPGMTATVTIETARRTDVLRVPVSATGFRPTPQVFASLGQDVPQEAQAPQAPERGETARARPDATRRPSSGSASGSARNGRGISSPAAGTGEAPTGTSGRGAPVQDEVWVLQPSRLTPVRVGLGLSDGTNVEITSGDLQAGDRVATGVSSKKAPAARPTASPLTGPARRPPGR